VAGSLSPCGETLRRETGGSEGGRPGRGGGLHPQAVGGNPRRSHMEDASVLAPPGERTKGSPGEARSGRSSLFPALSVIRGKRESRGSRLPCSTIKLRNGA